jgi:maleylpyruvate isomerase
VAVNPDDPESAAPNPGAVDPGAVRAAVLDGHARLRGLLGGLGDEAVREPSALPGWSRAHVLAHLAGVCRALTRQARYALRGELVEVYDGGRPARDAAIEAGALRSADELRGDLAGALTGAQSLWAAVGGDDWSRPVRYRDGDVRAVLLAWWRELEIHTADLRLGSGPEQWPRELCAHLLVFLGPRAPEGTRLILEAADGPERYAHGSGTEVAVRGDLRDLAAWLAGRTAPGPLGPAPLPELGPWPS